MYSIKIGTLNIMRIRSQSRIKVIIEWMRRERIDILAVQELSFDFLNDSEYELIENCGPHNAGTGFIVRTGIEPKTTVKEPYGRILKIEIGSLCITNIYAPSGDKKVTERSSFFKDTMPAYLGSGRGDNILLGDFNSTESEEDRIAKSKRRRPVKDCTAIKQLTSAYDFQDLWKRLKPGEEGHTFFRKSGSARLDRIYTSREVINSFSNIKTEPVFFSDHQPVLVEMSGIQPSQTRITNPKKSRWKMNTSILQEGNFGLLFESFFHESLCYHQGNTVADW